MRKITYWLLVGGVVYLIMQNPSATGDLFQDFFQLLGDGFNNFFEFLDAMFDGNDDVVTIEPTTEATPFDSNP